MQKYLARVKEIEKELDKQCILIQYNQISRSNNEEADLLGRLST